MKILLSILLVGIGGLCTPSIGWAQDHAAAPMIGKRVVPETIKEDPNASSNDSVLKIKSDFKRAYSRAGQPKVAIFWNRKLDDQLSQWYTSSRSVDTYGVDYDRNKGFKVSQSRIDVEGRFDDLPQPSVMQSFEFGAGFTRTLLNSGVNIVDRDTIMRLTHTKTQKEEAETIVVADYQQVEIDSLLGYADFIAEVLYAPGHKDGNPVNFMISIKEIKTGRLVAMFRSKKIASPNDGGFTYKWTTTSKGYERVKVALPRPKNPAEADGIDLDTLEYIGWNVGMQTMAALTKYWKSSGQ